MPAKLTGVGLGKDDNDTLTRLDFFMLVSVQLLFSQSEGTKHVIHSLIWSKSMCNNCIEGHRCTRASKHCLICRNESFLLGKLSKLLMPQNSI